MAITENSSLIDIAFAVCTALDAAAITAVLTGGAATMMYAGDIQPSDDADFVIDFGTDKEAQSVMERLSFTREGRIYTSNLTRFTVEFPTGSLSIGTDIINTWEKNRAR